MNPIIKIDPYKSLRRIERLMRQLKLGDDKRGKNEYHHGMIDGLGNAIAIIHDEIKAQSPRKRPAVKQLSLQGKQIIPWECWWEPQDERSV